MTDFDLDLDVTDADLAAEESIEVSDDLDGWMEAMLSENSTYDY